MPPQNYLHLNYSLLNLTGMCRLQNFRPFKRLLLQMWRITVNLNIFYFCFATLVYLVLEKVDDFQELFLCYVDFGCSLIALIRLNYFYAFDKLTEEVYDEMGKLFKYETHTGLEDKTLQKRSDLVNLMTRMWVVCGTMGSMCIVLAPLVFDRYSQRKLSFVMWYPFNWEVSPYYQMMIGYQAMVMLMMALSVIAVDMFFAGCVILTSAQFELLGWELKYLVHSVLIKNGAGEFLERNVFESKEEFHLKNSKSGDDFFHKLELNAIDAITGSENFGKDLLEGLNKLIKFHQSLMKFCKLIDDLFSPVYLPYIVFGAASSVFMAFNFTIFQKANLGIIITSGFTLSLMVITLLWPCYLGQVLLTQTEEFLDDIYSSLWYFGDEKFKASLKIMSCAASKPIRLTLGKFGFLSLQMYLKMINSIVSYVIVLRQMTGLNQHKVE